MLAYALKSPACMPDLTASDLTASDLSAYGLPACDLLAYLVTTLRCDTPVLQPCALTV